MGLQTSCGVAVNIVYPNIRHVPSYIKTESFEGTFKHFHHIVCGGGGCTPSCTGGGRPPVWEHQPLSTTGERTQPA